MTGGKPKTDWEAIEREYRAAQLSVREIARQFGVSHVAIGKKAKEKGWVQDLAEKVRKEVTSRLVTIGVTTSGAGTRKTVEEAAERVVRVVREHREDISEARKLTKALVAELRVASENREGIESEIALETASDANGKRRAMMLRAVSLPSRAGVITSLSAAMKNLISMERQAFNLDAATGGEPDEPATKADLVGMVKNLDGNQRDALRAIAQSLAERPEGTHSGD